MIGEHELAEIANRHLALAKQRDSLLAMLERLEWIDYGRKCVEEACPVCGGLKTIGHAPDCDLAALLLAAQGGR